MADVDEGRYIGQRVRMVRRRRGMTQQMLADRAGLSRGAIAKYETGERPVDSRRVLLDLAAALGVTIGDLTGHDQEKLNPATANFHSAVPELETVLWTRGNITDSAPSKSLDELARMARHATKLRHDCDYETLGPMLVPMLTDSYRHVHDAPAGVAGERAWDVFGTIAYGVASALRARGYHALAWNVAQEVERAAERSGEAAQVAAAAFGQGQIMLSRPGALRASLTTTMGAAEKIAPEAHTRGEIETLGMLHLQASITTATLGGDPEPYFAEAAEQAARLERADADTSTARNESFGSANVTLWRMSSAIERREPDRVLELAPQVRADDLPNEGRKAQYFVEIGRAHGMRKRHEEAMYSILRAESIAPQHVRGLSPVRELVGHMMRTARRDLTTGPLGKLAERVGALEAPGSARG
ncbi:helix-turn-helix domain-containing protein [Nocardia sp. NPDC004068]|uniref:helix-turn-helix domain-containing protein n=1 Tax=Nocardia sp. NPDC004068 TaxID=3364303 RepID=UPI0036A40E54